MKKAIIFDIGKVVISFHLLDLYKVFAEKAGIPWEFIDSFRKEKSKEFTLGEMTKEDFFGELQKHAKNFDAAGLEKLWIEEGSKLIEINQELVDWIQEHRGKYTIGALTNLHPARLLLDEKIGIKNYFDFVALSCIEHLKKPDPAFYNLALQQAGVEAQDVVFVDDNPDYVLAAKQLGFKDVLFTENKSLFAALEEF